MLITTHTGILVNTAHVAFVALRQQAPEGDKKTPDTSEARKHRVVLFLTGGDPLVAADQLTRAAAEFLRKDLAQQWAEGSTLFDVNTSLCQHQGGAYFAEVLAQEKTGGQ